MDSSNSRTYSIFRFAYAARGEFGFNAVGKFTGKP